MEKFPPEVLPLLKYLSGFSDPDEDLDVHEDESDERKNSCGEGRMPDEGQGVPEDEGRVTPSVGCIDVDVRPVGIGHSDLEKLGDVQGEGEGSDWDYIDQHSLSTAHRLKKFIKKTFGHNS